MNRLDACVMRVESVCVRVGMTWGYRIPNSWRILSLAPPSLPLPLT